MLALGVVEQERGGERVEDLLRGAGGAAPLQARVVVDAHAGEHGDLLAAQAGNPSVPADDGQARHLRSDLGASGGQEVLDLRAGVDRCGDAGRG